MKITSFTIRRSDVTKENIQNSNFPYDSVVNNNTSSTSEEITAAAASVPNRAKGEAECITQTKN